MILYPTGKRCILKFLDINSSMIAAVLQAKACLKYYDRKREKVQLILISLHHVRFVELSTESMIGSEVLPLVINTPAEAQSNVHLVFVHLLMF